MKLNVYAIKDNLAGFLQPTFEQSDEIAERNFKFAVNKPESLLYADANDFSLYRLGVYDSELGTIEPNPPVLVVHASSVLEVKNGK